MSLLKNYDENKQQNTTAQADTQPKTEQVIQTPTASQSTNAAQQNAGQSSPAATQTASQSTNATPTTAATTTTSGSRSAAYEKAMQTLKQAQTNAPTYSSSYDDDINEIYSQIVNRPAFKYDYSADPLYNQYKDQYTQLGKQAMKDTMGQTAALTGGYGNSYGSAVGQQQYDAYLQRLNDVVPELYSQAYNIYERDADKLNDQYAMLLDRQNTEYNEWRDALSDYRYDQALELDKAQQLASDLAAYGDFSGYGELYGQDAADKMFNAWAAQYADLAHATGQITDDQYDNLINGKQMNDGLDENGHRIVVPTSGGGDNGAGAWYDPRYDIRYWSAGSGGGSNDSSSAASVLPSSKTLTGYTIPAANPNSLWRKVNG